METPAIRRDPAKEAKANKLAPSFYEYAPEFQVISLIDYYTYFEGRLKWLNFLDNGVKEPRATELQGLEDPKIDEITHFVLRFAHCSSEENVRFFVRAETRLFRSRLTTMSGGLKKFVQEKNLVEIPSATELETVKQRFEQQRAEAKEIYRLPFEKATTIVSRLDNEMLLDKGYVYFTSKLLPIFLEDQFRKNLQVQMEKGRKTYLMRIKDQPHLTQLFAQLTVHNVQGTFQQTSGKCSLQEINEKWRTLFPLCMRVPHAALIQNHHLRYFSRQQLGLFVKSLGLSVEENIEYFRFWFCKNMTDADFKKRYEYNIQHMYGRRGAMKVHRAMNCSQIIQQTPSAIDHHGCPFKTHDPTNLRKLLVAYGLSEVAIADILEKAKLHQYQSACCEEFVAHHPGIARQSIVHPNGYSDAVLKYMRPDDAAGKRPGEDSTGAASKKAKVDK